MTPPSIVNTFFEAAWFGLELMSLPLNKLVLRGIAPRGDGSPVLVLPGVMTDDAITSPLRTFLKDIGYRTYSWRGGLNIGFSDATAKHLADRLDYIYKKTGQKVALVGHSLGGIYARELARAFPDKVSKVITLGSAFGIDDKFQAVNAPLRALFHASAVVNPTITDKALLRRSLIPPPVPTTSIFSHMDGMVSWQACLNPNTRHSENIEINGGHIGSLMNPGALLAIADRLAQPVKGWKRFDPDIYDMPYSAAKPYKGTVPDMPKATEVRNAPKLFKYA